MKAKKILFTVSGILKIVVGVGVLGLFLLVFLLNGLLKEALMSDMTTINEVVQTMILEDPENAFLLELGTEELVSYLLGTLTPLCIFMIVWGLVSIGLGVFTIILSKKYDSWLRNSTSKKIIFTIVDYIGYVGLLANILTTIGVYLKDKSIDEMVIGN